MEIIRLSVAPIGENCYIVSEGKEAFIVDPGGEADKIINAAKKVSSRTGLPLSSQRLFHGFSQRFDINEL